MTPGRRRGYDRRLARAVAELLRGPRVVCADPAEVRLVAYRCRVDVEALSAALACARIAYEKKSGDVELFWVDGLSRKM